MCISSNRRIYLAPETEVIVVEEEKCFMDSTLTSKSFSFGQSGVEEDDSYVLE